MHNLTGAPYAVAPFGYFLFTELGVYAFLIACLVHAGKRRDGALPCLLGGITFGLLLEFFEVLSGSYSYGHFWLMLGRAPMDVPLFVGVAWGVIMYTARLFSDALGLPTFGAAALDTLLALGIDISMDTVAYRMHFWNWDWNGTGRDPLTANWFGIPYGNFVGWITVVFCYSLFSRIFERRLLGKRQNLLLACSVPMLAVATSLAVLCSTEILMFPALNRIGVTSGPRWLILALSLMVLTVLGWRRRNPSAEKPHRLAVWVPAWFHLLFAYCFVVLGFYRENPWLTIATATSLLLGIAIHCFPIRMRSASREPAPDGEFVGPFLSGR
jgi:uncharacterized membrane protein